MKMKKCHQLVITAFIFQWALTSYADEKFAYQALATPENSPTFTQLTQLPFDENKFNLAYQSFVYSGDVQSAYALTIAACSQNPDSKLWLERHAQTARWSNHQQEALNAYIKLITQFNEKKYIADAATLGETLGRYSLLINLYHTEIKKYPRDIKLMQKLALAYNNMGQPKKGERYLLHAYQQTKKPELLETLTAIYIDNAQQKEAINTLVKIKATTPHTAKATLKIAELMMNQGKYQKAFEELTRITPPTEAKLAKHYWDQLAFAAWILGRDTESRQAYLQQYEQHDITEEGLRRLFLLENAIHSNRSIPIALTAWNTYHSPYAFFSLIPKLYETHDWSTLNTLYQTKIPTKKYKLLKSEPAYWQGLALLHHAKQEDSNARQLLRQQILLHSNVQAFQELYFNFLIYQSSLFSLQPAVSDLIAAMHYYQSQLFKNDDWLNAYTNAFNLINEPKKSLVTATIILNKSPNNIDYLIQKSNILFDLGYFKSSRALRERAKILMQAIPLQTQFEDNSLLSNYLDLYAASIPIQDAQSLRYYLAKERHFTTPLLAYAIDAYHINLADRLLYQNLDKPLFAVNKLALIHHDKSIEHRLVTTTAKTLSQKDAIEAALDAGDIRIAQQIAYENLKQHHDKESFSLFNTAMMKTVNSVHPQVEFEQFGNLQGMREILQSNVWFNGLLWTPYLSTWNPQSNNTGNIAAHSYLENIANLSAQTTSHDLTTALQLGYHRAFFTSYNAYLKMDYHYDHESRWLGKLAYNQRSTLDAFMLIAGSQDEYQLRYENQWTPRDLFSTEIEYNQYQLQDRTQLGSGQFMRFGLTHQFYFDYPDVNINWLTDFDRFKRYHSFLSPSINVIFPRASQAQVSAFIPTNFWQTALTLQLGNNALNKISHRIRPYANVGLIYNQTAGYGHEVDLGLTTRVFGHDALKAYYTRSSVNSGQSQTNFIVGIDYELYL